MMNRELNKLVELLELVLAEEIECGLAEFAFNKICWDELRGLEPVYSNLHHYWHDEDIRSREEAYRQFQSMELRKLIIHLRNGDLVKANGVSFLHESECP